MENNTTAELPLRLDLFSSAVIGILAGLFATIALINLGLFGKEVFGVTLTIPLVFVAFITLCIAGIAVARLAGKVLPILYKFIKFGEAGGLNWLVDLGVVNLLIFLTGFSTGFYFALFKGISFICASSNSFVWNKYWVFSGAKKQEQSKEIGKFAVATTLGMAVNIVIASLIAYFGPVIFGGLAGKTWANVATIVGSLTAMLFNFIIYKIWVFRS